MIEFDESKRNFLKTTAKLAAVLTVVAVAPVAIISLLKTKPKFVVDLDVNGMYPCPAPDIGSLYVDAGTDKIYKKIALNEQYGKFGTPIEELKEGYFYAPWISRIQKTTIIG